MFLYDKVHKKKRLQMFLYDKVRPDPKQNDIYFVLFIGIFNHK
jgi:hypothetical protein